MSFFVDLEHEPVKRTNPLGFALSLSFPDGVKLPEGLLDLAAGIEDVCGDSHNAFTIYALSESETPGGIVFFLHGHVETNGTIGHFTIEIKRRPEVSPPDYVIEGNKKTGGYPAVLERIFGLFDQQEIKCEAKGEFYFAKKPIKASSKEKKIGPYQLESKRLAFRPIVAEDGTKTTVGYLAWPDNIGSITDVETQLFTSLSPTCIEDISAILWKYASLIYESSNEK